MQACKKKCTGEHSTHSVAFCPSRQVKRIVTQEFLHLSHRPHVWRDALETHHRTQDARQTLFVIAAADRIPVQFVSVSKHDFILQTILINGCSLVCQKLHCPRSLHLSPWWSVVKKVLGCGAKYLLQRTQLERDRCDTCNVEVPI